MSFGPELLCEPARVCHTVRRLERRQDALEPRQLARTLREPRVVDPRYSVAPDRAATRARVRPRHSRDPPRSSGSARCCRARPAARRCACPAARRRAAGEARRVAARRCRSPPASTPIRRTPRSSTNASKMPIALLPPPTHATTAVGSRPACSKICALASRPITDWNSRTMSGYGCGPAPSRAGSRCRRRW